MRVLILKDVEQNSILSSRVLTETENIYYEIVENAPVIEEREGYIGQYALNSNGELIVEYKEVELTDVEQLEARVSEMQEMIAMMVYNDISGNSTSEEEA